MTDGLRRRERIDDRTPLFRYIEANALTEDQIWNIIYASGVPSRQTRTEDRRTGQNGDYSL